MEIKIEKETEVLLTVSVKHEEFVIIADYPRELGNDGTINAENISILSEEEPNINITARMMQEMGTWIVKHHSDKFFKKNKILDEIREIMERENISYYRLGKISGVPQMSINRYLNGKVTPSLDNIIKICEALGYDLVLQRK